MCELGCCHLLCERGEYVCFEIHSDLVGVSLSLSPLSLSLSSKLFEDCDPAADVRLSCLLCCTFDLQPKWGACILPGRTMSRSRPHIVKCFWPTLTPKSECFCAAGREPPQNCCRSCWCCVGRSTLIAVLLKVARYGGVQNLILVHVTAKIARVL